MFVPCEISFRKSALLLNRVLWRQEETAFRARILDNLIEREGKAAHETIGTKVEKILSEHGFTREGPFAEQEPPCAATKAIQNLPVATIQKAINELNQANEQKYHIDLKYLKETFEDPFSIKANISLDDVYSKKQKETDRDKNAPPPKKKEKVKNTIAH